MRRSQTVAVARLPSASVDRCPLLAWPNSTGEPSYARSAVSSVHCSLVRTEFFKFQSTLTDDRQPDIQPDLFRLFPLLCGYIQSLREGHPLKFAFVLRGLLAGSIIVTATIASAQPRVQFPSAVPEGAPYTPPPPGAVNAPPAPALGSPPAWDPYSGTAAPPPTVVDPAAAPPGQPTTFVGNATRFLQGISFDNTFIAGSNTGTNLGIDDIETAATFAIPIFRNPFLVTPGFAAHFWNGPDSDGYGVYPGPEMPPETYDAYLDTTWKPQITPRLSADLAFRAGVYSDFNYVTSRSVRFPARGLGLYAVNPNFTIAAGVVYLDRLSVRILPAGGVIWTPDQDTRYEILFPRPKLTHRVATVRNSNLWWFVEGEYGGNTWTIHRSQLGGFGDVVDYNDLRLSMGFEWIAFNGRRANFEVGYVFNRRLMYRSGYTPTTYPHGTVMMRTGLQF